MSWQVAYKPTFLKELAQLPPKLRRRVEAFAFEEMPKVSNPYALAGVTKLRGYRGLRIDKKTKLIEFCRILHRREIYRYFP
jgi:mRNA-degrading endonuclease RelE of RelBE toxin-antitoxin system